MTEPAPLPPSTDKNRIGARAGRGMIVTLENYRTNPSASICDAPLPKSPGQEAAEMSNGSVEKAAQEARKSLTSYYLLMVGLIRDTVSLQTTYCSEHRQTFG
jgi:hypothetical protein